MNQCKYCKKPIPDEAIACNDCIDEVQHVIDTDEVVNKINSKFALWNFSLTCSCFFSVIAFIMTYATLENNWSDTLGIISLISLIIFLIASVICAIAKFIYKKKIMKKVDEVMFERHSS